MTRKDIKTFKAKDSFALFEIHQEVSRARRVGSTSVV